MVSNNMIPKCPITDSGFNNSHIMFGPNLNTTRVKTVIQKPYIVVMDYVSVPR